MNSLAKILMRSRLASRTFAAKTKPGKSSKVIEKPHPKGKKIKELQRKFTVDDGVPVYLKGGASDKILFQVCAGGLLIGFVMALDVFYRLIIPGKKPGFEGKSHEDEDE